VETQQQCKNEFYLDATTATLRSKKNNTEPLFCSVLRQPE